MKHIKKTYLNKAILSLFMVMVFYIVIAVNAFAMGISISFSEVSANVGDEVTLVMTVSSTGGDIDSSTIMLSYDESMLDFISGTNAQGDAGSIKITSNTGSISNSQSFSLKFKAKSPGDATVVVSTWEVYDRDSKMATMESQGSGRIKITEAPISQTSETRMSYTLDGSRCVYGDHSGSWNIKLSSICYFKLFRNDFCFGMGSYRDRNYKSQ